VSFLVSPGAPVRVLAVCARLFPYLPLSFSFLPLPPPPISPLFPYTTLFRSISSRPTPWRLCLPQALTARSRRTKTSCWKAQNVRSEEHTSELQSRFDLVCRLLLEKKKTQENATHRPKTQQSQAAQEQQRNCA